MKQVTQSLDNGVVRVLDVPVPAVGPHSVLVRNAFSLISAGTERSKIELGRAGLIGKARRRPKDVGKVLDKVRREGLLSTYKMVKTRLEEASPLGYSSAGTVVEVGELVEGIRPGDRVACGGAGYANHAEYVAVPGNLCAKVPDGLDSANAAYATVGAIAMQGFRQSECTVGDTIAVIGMGLVGQLVVAIGKWAGCRVIAVDPDTRKTQLAVTLGAEIGVDNSREGAESSILSATGDRGVDAVIIAAATASAGPVELAGEIARDRGTVVIVGDVAMDLPRESYYEKELTLRLSRSYGPGRYDPMYEEYGVDYPVGYVRWTERRNMEEFLRLAAAGAVDLQKLTTHRFPILDAPAAYEAILSGDDLVVGALLEYDASDGEAGPQRPGAKKSRTQRERVGVGLIGAGNFATATLLPALVATGDVELVGIASSGGLSAGDIASRFGFKYSTESVGALIDDEDVDTIVIATRHDTHAELVVRALRAGKVVYTEKPLAVTADELASIIETREGSNGDVMVGFNRRFAPYSAAIRDALTKTEAPCQISIRVNAGTLPASHWTQQLESGGGRIVGEMCHFIDLACFLAGARPRSVYACSLGESKAAALADSLIATLRFEDGSIATVSYCAQGDPAAGKELIEVFSAGRTWSIDDFKALSVSENGDVKRSSGHQDKGHREEMREFVALARGNEPKVLDFDAAVASTRATLAVIESLCTGQAVDLRAAGSAEA